MQHTVRRESIYVGADEDDSRGLLELSEEDRIVDSEARGANRVVFYVATPVQQTYECGVNGCSRDVEGPEDQCWQHSEDES